jgi:hypothetical protein
VEAEAVLKQQFVYGGAGSVRFPASQNWIFSISLWVYIKLAAGQQNSLYPCKQPGDAVLPFVQWNDDWRRPGGTEGGKIGGQ